MATTKKSESTTKTASKTVTKKPTAKMTKTTPENTENKPTNKHKKLLKNNKLVIVLILVVIVAILYFAKSVFIVATVNGQPITRLEIIQELELQGGKATIDQLVINKLIVQEAKKKNIVISQEDLDSKIQEFDDIYKEQGSSFEEVLELQGLTKSFAESKIKLEIMKERLVEDNIEISDEEVDGIFEQELENKPEELSDEDFKDEIRDQIRIQQLGFEIQTYMQDLQSQADIKYYKEY